MGILDGFYNSDTGTLTPQGYGLLGMIQGLGNAPGIAPQAASRLPLARPNLLNVLGNEAGGYLQGTQSAARQQAETNYIKAQGGKDNLGTLSLLNRYNLTAPIFGASPLSMNDLLAGKFDSKTMQAVQGAQTQATPAMAAPGMAPGQQPPQQPNLLQHIFSGILGGGQQPQPQAPQQASPAMSPAMISGATPAPSLPPPGVPSGPPGMNPAMIAQNGAPSTGILSGNAQPQGGTLGGQGPGGINMDLVRRNVINQDVYGVGLTPVQKNIIAMGGDPGDPQYKQLLQNEAIKASGINPSIGGERAGVPFQTYDPATNSMRVAPGALQNLTAGAAAAEAGKYPYKLGEIAAQGGQSRQTAQFTADLPFGPPGGTAAPGIASPALAPTMPKVATSTPAGSPAPAKVNPDGSVMMSDRSVLPPVSEQAAPNPTRAGREEEIKQTRTTENDWYKVVQTSQIAEQRALAIADALKKTQSGNWATDKAEVAGRLKAVGINLPTNILGDTAQVQIALKDNFNAVLEQIKQFSSRPAAAEVTLAQKNFSNPDLQPTANLSIIGQVVGTLRWERSMLNGWPQAKKMGWQNPQEYERAWTNRNNLPAYIEDAVKSIGPLKGMEGAGNQQLSDPLGIRR